VRRGALAKSRTLGQSLRKNATSEEAAGNPANRAGRERAMSDIPTPAAGQTAVLIDFENLVLGLRDMRLPNWERSCDVEAIIDLAEEYGTVAFSNAYADWRHDLFNQFQIDLDRLGVDLVQIFTRSRGGEVRKNAADVRMAVDAIETVWTLPQIQTFVIVTGDRDFMHVLKALRRHGKNVIGIAGDRSVSNDYAALCDRFIKYSALVPVASKERPEGTAEAAAKVSWKQIKQAVARLLATRADGGIKISALKPHLRREFPTFDEREYDCDSFTAFVKKMPDVIRIHPSRTGGEPTLFPATAPAATAPGTESRRAETQTDLIRRARLAGVRFEPDPRVRRDILALLFEAIPPNQPLTWNDLIEDLLSKQTEFNLSGNIISQYLSILHERGCFTTAPETATKAIRRRTMLRSREVADLNEFIFRYESGIVQKVAKTIPNVTPEQIARVLGLDGDPATIAPQLDYCRHLMAAAPVVAAT
jgi:uncharacterized protein (TIGR00288 family)